MVEEAIDGHTYSDLLQVGGPTVLGSNPAEVREKIHSLLDECGPSTGLFHESEYRLADTATCAVANTRGDLLREGLSRFEKILAQVTKLG